MVKPAKSTKLAVTVFLKESALSWMPQGARFHITIFLFTLFIFMFFIALISKFTVSQFVKFTNVSLRYDIFLVLFVSFYWLIIISKSNTRTFLTGIYSVQTAYHKFSRCPYAMEDWTELLSSDKGRHMSSVYDCRPTMIIICWWLSSVEGYPPRAVFYDGPLPISNKGCLP